MKNLRIILVSTAIALAAGNPLRAAPGLQVSRARAFPTDFIENQGQMDPAVKYFVAAGNQSLWFTQKGVTIGLAKKQKPEEHGKAEEPAMPERLQRAQTWKHAAVGQEFPGSNPAPRIEGRGKSATRYNFLIGNDPSKLRANVSAAKGVAYRELYPRIDLEMYINGGALEQEFVVQPGGDPAKIRVKYRGVEGLEPAKDGSLRIRTALGDLQEGRPVVYQVGKDGKRVEVKCRLRIFGEATYGFEAEAYDAGLALVIDPTLVFSSYLGGTGEDLAFAAGHRDGAYFVGGRTMSSNFPADLGSYQGSFDGFVGKLSDSSGGFEFLTWLGGSGSDEVVDLALDSSMNLFLTGFTDSTDWSIPDPGVFRPTAPLGGDAFVAKLNSAGSTLHYFTYLGGSNRDYGYRVVVDGEGNAFVVGFTHSDNFPNDGVIRPGHGNPGGRDGFISKLSLSADRLIYSNYLGGNADDYATCLAIDSIGNAYVGGSTDSSNFPTTLGALQLRGRGAKDCFVSKISPGGQSLYGTLYGGSGEDRAYSLVLDSQNRVVVGGYTQSRDIGSTKGVIQSNRSGSDDGIVFKLDLSLSKLIFCTFFGAGSEDYSEQVSIDAADNVYIAGATRSLDLTNRWVTPDALQSNGAGDYDAFVAKMNPEATKVLFGSYLGGEASDYPRSIAVGACGDVVITGQTFSTDFVTSPGAARVRPRFAAQ